MKKESRDTINKSLLLHWLYSADKDLPLEELGKWIAVKTDGRYTLVKNNDINLVNSLDKIKHK